MISTLNVKYVPLNEEFNCILCMHMQLTCLLLLFRTTSLSCFVSIENYEPVTFKLHFQAGDFVHSIGDTHIYVNHVEPLKLQVCMCVQWRTQGVGAAALLGDHSGIIFYKRHYCW